MTNVNATGDGTGEVFKVRFAFYWECGDESKVFADYFIESGRVFWKDTEHGPMFLRKGMNVEEAQLTEAGQAIPPTPTYAVWKEKVAKKLRCGKCYATLRGTNDDYDNHLSKNHMVGRGL